MKKIAFCAGHGGSGSTPGKRTPDNEYEWGFNNTVAKAFADELAKYEGIELKRFDDSSGKTDIPLNTRTNNANNWGADYYISFHHNALSGKWGSHGGVETFIHTNPNQKSIALANAVHPALVKAYGLRDRGVKRDNLHIVRETNCPAILIEGGFMDSIVDIKVLRDPNKLKYAGTLIAQAVAAHLNLKFKYNEKLMQSTAENTFRKEAIKEIKAAVNDKRFTSTHPDVESYSTLDLLFYSNIAVLRRK